MINLIEQLDAVLAKQVISIDDPHGIDNANAVAADFLRDNAATIRAALRDAERLDWLDKNCTRVADSERYLPRQVYWGKGTHRDVRAAIDKAMGGGGE